MEQVLEFASVCKSFPGVQALSDISMQVCRGEVRGLIGENGAGKSTLLKVLSGAYQPTSGRITIAGKEREILSTRDGLEAGIAVIYQELYLVPEMTVAENLLLGHMPTRRSGLIDVQKMYDTAKAQLTYILEDIDPNTKIKELPIAQRQMIEIAKALLHNASIIAFDEPTSSLSDKETQRLFKIIAALRDEGKAIIYVSHRMEELFEVCDSVTVFRDGKTIETFREMAAVTPDMLVQRMVGRDIKDIYHYYARPLGEEVLKLEGFTGPGVPTPVSFSAKRGEILGFFGLVGAGRTELMKLLFGAEKKHTGRIHLNGKEVVINAPMDAIELGIAFLPEDRKNEGIIPIRSVEENINLSARRKHVKGKFFLDVRWEAQNALEFIKKLSIKTPSKDQLIMNLSGGNQQKVILARWLSEKTSIIVMDEPTRGIDVGTKNEIYSLMYKLTEEGKTILCVSSELPEIMGISDRVAVMRDGCIVDILQRDQLDKERILTLALPDRHKSTIHNSNERGE